MNRLPDMDHRDQAFDWEEADAETPFCTVCPYQLNQDGTDVQLADGGWAHEDCAAECFNCARMFPTADLYMVSRNWRVCPSCAKDNAAIAQGREYERRIDERRGH